ncbi:hypothetical protein DN757_13395 [Paenibacillus silvae]|uniref:Uncharacterized protein n=1 Tax=Paenibacillus silvae TaxID=1325358 RepID=A0A2W6PAQ4_9BACL|nr:hypothetical protein DN757_13395 [Paenibacillus silvae]
MEHTETIEGADHAEHIECMKTIEVMGDLLVCLGTVGNFVGICLKSWDVGPVSGMESCAALGYLVLCAPNANDSERAYSAYFRCN